MCLEAKGGVSYGNRTSPELIEQQKIASEEHAQRLIELLEKTSRR